MNGLQRRCIAGAILGSMVFMAALYVLQGSLLNSIIDSFKLVDTAQGLPATMASIGGVIALVSSFFLIGRFSKLKILRAVIILAVFFLVLLWFVRSFWLFVVLWLSLGICIGYMDMLMSSCMSDLFEGREATRMMCILHGTYGAGSMLIPVAFAAMLRAGIYWRTAYLAVAVFGFLILIAISVFLKRIPEAAASVQEMEVLGFGKIIHFLTRNGFPLLLIAVFFHGMFLSGCINWINRYVGVGLNSDLGDIALTFLFLGVMIARLGFPFLRIKTVEYIRIGGIISGLILILAVVVANGIFAAVAIGFSGLTFGALFPCMITLGCQAIPESSMLATSSLMLALYLGETIVHPLIAKLASMNLAYGVLLIAAAMIMASVMCLVNKSLKEP